MSTKGYKHTPEAKANMAAAKIGNTNCLGYKHTDKTKAKMGASHLGSKRSEGTKAKMSAILIGNTRSLGKKHTLVGKLNHSAAEMGEKNHQWKGGWVFARKRSEEKRRGFGYIPLNDRFIGSEGHHIDKEFVIYIPTEMHRSVPHNVHTGKGMEQINTMAVDFCYGD